MSKRSQLEELLDLIEQLLRFLRPWTFDELPGEAEAFERAQALLRRYRPDTHETTKACEA